MKRSRAFNRFNRFTAKRRRNALRSDIPCMSEEFSKVSEPIDQSQGLREKALQKEALSDFLDV